MRKKIFLRLLAKMDALYLYCASLHNQKKDNNKFKNKKQPELTENPTVWKSDNQEVKESIHPD